MMRVASADFYHMVLRHPNERRASALHTVAPYGGVVPELACGAPFVILSSFELSSPHPSSLTRSSVEPAERASGAQALRFSITEVYIHYWGDEGARSVLCPVAVWH